ncbi:hypothetical protein FHG87_017455 [Trinorchestia longiramus]|nr:hypothetical protein FHG87_017455 [Trinorchestia longiramus]
MLQVCGLERIRGRNKGPSHSWPSSLSLGDKLHLFEKVLRQDHSSLDVLRQRPPRASVTNFSPTEVASLDASQKAIGLVDLVDLFFAAWPPCCAHLITLENGDTFAVWAVMDLSSCLTDGDDGVPLLLATYLYNFTSPVVYFLNECGNTIRIPNLNQFGFMMTYSHEGFGCVYYPSEAADECTVTFESEDPVGFGLEVRSYFPELEDGCTGFNMTITGSTLHSNQTETINACRQYGTFEYLSLRDKSCKKTFMWRCERKSEGAKEDESG